MTLSEQSVFFILFREAYSRSFKTALHEPMSQEQSVTFSNSIKEATGSIISPRTLQNYAVFVLEGKVTGRVERNDLDLLTNYVHSTLVVTASDRSVKAGWEDYLRRHLAPAVDAPASRSPLIWLQAVAAVVLLGLIWSC